MEAGSFAELTARASAMSDAELEYRMRENDAVHRRWASTNSVLIAEAERRKSYRPDGHATMFGQLRSTLHWSEAECRDATQLARLVEAYPDVGESLFETWLSVANAVALAKVHANPNCAQPLESRIGELLNDATRSENHDLKLRLHTFVLRHDRRERRRHALADARRGGYLKIGEHGGTLVCNWGAFDADRNRQVLEKQLEVEFEADWAITEQQHGDLACESLMPRTRQQRFADAVTAIFQRSAAAPPGSKPPQPVGNIHLDWTSYCDLMTEHSLFPERHVDPFEDPTPLISKMRCDTSDGAPIDPDTALRVILEGLVRFVIHDDEGVPIRWGRAKRLFTGAAREAVMSLSHRCTHPGCRVPAGRCQADHLVDWQRGGQTRPDNGGPRCGRHNRMRNKGYSVERDRLGNWHTYRPDGTEIC
jgi:hypothetical protein